MATTWLLARITFREAVRKRMILGVLLLSAIFIALYAFGFVRAQEEFLSRTARRGNNPLTLDLLYNFLVLMGFYIVNFLAGIMAIFTAVGSVSSEIESNTFHAVVPKPLARWQIVVGKWLGYGLMLTAYVVLMTSSVLATAWFVGGYVPHAPLAAVGLVVLVALLLLSLTVLGSTILSTITNGIVVFMLYGIALTGGIVEQIGILFDSQVMKAIGIVASLAIPSDVVWKLAAYLLQAPSTISLGPTLFTPATPPSNAMIVYALLYMLLAITGGILVFNRRDL
jgi:Cu-processing system permease protein